MNRTEKSIVITALVYMALYVPYFLMQGYRDLNGAQISPLAIFPLHFLGMALNLAALIVTIRDLYLRPFANPNSKLTWLLLILCTNPVGWLLYLWKHAMRPRTSVNAGSPDS